MSSVDPQAPRRSKAPPSPLPLSPPALSPPPLSPKTPGDGDPNAPMPPAISPMAPYVAPESAGPPQVIGKTQPASPRAPLVVDRPAAPKKHSTPGKAPALGRIALPDVGPRGQKPNVPPPKVAVADSEEEPSKEISEYAVQHAPPFLVSTLVHMLLVIVLALITFGRSLRNQVELAAVYSDTRGLQLLDDKMQSLDVVELENLEPAFAVGLTPVENPFAAPPNLPVSPNALQSASTVEAPTIGMALTGRQAGLKKALMPIYGATATTEGAVVAGLEWLKRQQMRDGGWSLVGPYPDASQFENRCAATAMALLAFQGYGTTHLDGGGQPVDFHDVVKRGWDFLLKMQDKDGVFVHDATHNQRSYAQAQATIAICEIFGMTKDEKFKRPAQLALDYAHKAQSPDLGGWRYEPRVDSDVSVTGWYVMALQSGLMAGLEVQSPNLTAISEFLDKASIENGTQYCYTIGGKPSLTMTAEAMLCRQYLGWRHDDPRLRAGIDQILANRIDYDEDMNVYYWYYATQACHHMDGEDWRRWNEVMRERVPAAQIKTGSNRGSWNPNADRWGAHGGRMYVTCLSVFMLESYYRHLPIYQWRLK